MAEQEETKAEIGGFLIVLGVLTFMAGLIGGAIFAVGASEACPSYRLCDVSDRIAERQYTMLAIYSVVGGIVSGAVLAVLGEISKNIAKVANLLTEPDDSED